MIFANDLLTEPNHKSKTAGKAVQKQNVNFYYEKNTDKLIKKTRCIKTQLINLKLKENTKNPILDRVLDVHCHIKKKIP